MLVANGLTGTMTAVTIISAAIAVLMTVAALLLLRDVGRLERRLLAAAAPSQAPAPPPADSRRREEAIEAKTRFLATVSHEIRTPLNGVLGMAELLAGTRIDAEQHSYVSAIKTSGEALLALIDEILDFSKIEVGKLDLVSEEVEIGALVEGVAELLAPRAQGKGIEIAASVAGDLPARIIGDGGRLRQVLINLAGNAVKSRRAPVRLPLPIACTACVASKPYSVQLDPGALAKLSATSCAALVLLASRTIVRAPEWNA